MNYPVWLWRPEAAMEESLEWMTDIIESHDGTEQRIQVRQAPRQSFRVSALFSNPVQASRLRVLLSSWQHKIWGWPVWNEESRLTAAALVGAFSIELNNTYGDWREGGSALVFESPTKHQVLEIQEVTANGLVFTAPLISTYAAGSCAFPLRMARLSGKADRQDYVGNELEYSLSVSILDTIELASSASPIQYLGYDVLTDKILLEGSTVKRQFVRPLDVLDPGPGEWSVISRTDFPSIVTEHKWVLKTQQHCWDFRKWLHRRSGALRPIWVPSYVDDLALAEVPSSSSTLLKVYDTNYRNVGLNKVGITHIAAFSPSGGFVCRKILNAVAGVSGQENLTINASLGFSGATKISFLSLNRFMGDKITLKWDFVGSAICSTSMVTVSA